MLAWILSSSFQTTAAGTHGSIARSLLILLLCLAGLLTRLLEYLSSNFIVIVFFFKLYFWSRSKPYLRVLSAYRPYQELSPKFHFRCFSSLSKQPQVFSVRLIPWFPWVLSGMPIAHGHSNGAFWFTHQRFHFHRAPLQCLGGCLLQKLKMPQETPPSYSFFLQVLHHALLLC